jgi:ribA/ribD-fused uncharacterized protein
MNGSAITSFRGDYRFLSNFYPSPVPALWGIVADGSGVLFPTVEHAYQASKTSDFELRERILRAPTPSRAKQMGKSVPLSPGWEARKLLVMEELLRWKFLIPELRQQLLSTGNQTLVEGNSWGDTFWGVCNSVGENNLGKLLMKIRQEIHMENLSKTTTPVETTPAGEEKGTKTLSDIGLGVDRDPHSLLSLLGCVQVQAAVHVTSHTYVAQRDAAAEDRLKVVGLDLLDGFLDKGHPELSCEERITLLLQALTTECVMAMNDASFQAKIVALNASYDHE